MTEEMRNAGSLLPDMVVALVAAGWENKNHHDNWVHPDYWAEYDTHEAYRMLVNPPKKHPLKTEELKTELFQTLGAVSMCWEPRPTGVFMSTEANQYGENLFQKIRTSVPLAMEILAEALKNDPDYRIGWVSNLAMAFHDEYYGKQFQQSEQDGEQVHAAMNRAAENFITQLTNGNN